MPVVVVTSAESEPISLADAKKHLRLSESFTEDDTLIEDAISAARKIGENRTHRAWGVQTYDAYFDVFPGSDQPLELPLPPLLSVESVQYVDLEGVAVTLPAEDYEIDKVSMVGSIFPAFGKIWPETRGRKNGVVVRFRAGYEILPKDLAGWLKITMADLYQNPESVVHSGSPTTLDFVDTLLDSYIIPVVA